MAMYYYHVFINYLDKKGKLEKTTSFGYSDVRLLKEIVNPINEDIPFLLQGSIVHPSQIEKILIFSCEEKNPYNILLPNGTKAIDETDKEYLIACFMQKRASVPTNEVTAEFINPSTTKGPVPARQLEKRIGLRKIFMVHGRVKEQALELQKYLKDELHQDAEMFEDVKKRYSSKTIIELLEYIVNNVAYAFVVATPDDFGCFGKDLEKCERELLLGKETVKAEEVTKLIARLNRRARQNVVFEHGLFIGALGRDRVCCLLQEGVTEQESDIHGILYEGFKESVSEKFTDIKNKLENPELGLIKK